MELIKALNNNMILVKDADGIDCICQGKGIGFQKKRGDAIAEHLIERKFKLQTQAESKHFEQLIVEIPEEYFKIAIAAYDYGKNEMGLKLNEHMVLPLCDHLYMCKDRFQNKVWLNNPLLFDIERVYPKEFQCGKHTMLLLQEYLHSDFLVSKAEAVDNEAAFVGYHFINAQLAENMEIDTDESVKLIGALIDIVQKSFQISLDVSDWNYQRFLTHLKFFAGRILMNQRFEDPEDETLLESISASYKPVRLCVERIAEYILINYHFEISSDEKLYLLVHIERVTRKFRKKKINKE